MRNKIISIMACLLVLCAAVLCAVCPDHFYSETEKRKLTQLDALSLSLYPTGELSTKTEEYLSDQFPMRDSWVSLKTYTDLAFGKREANGVYIGKDDYLIDKFSGYKTQILQANTEKLLAVSDALKENDISFQVMLVPSAVEVLTDKLPAYAPHASQQAVIDYAVQQGLPVVDIETTLKAHAEEEIYYRTDHHWASLGAYYAYAAWRESNGHTAAPLTDWTMETLCDNFRGTTWNKINLPSAAYDSITAFYHDAVRSVDYNNGEYLTDSIYERKFLDGADQYAVFFNSNQAQTVITGNGEGKLLVIKDSYANTFCQFVLDDYAEVHMIDPRFFQEDLMSYIEQNGITEVLALYGIPGFVKDSVIPVM